MIDFTGVGSIVIPEGSVAKITKKSGELLWEKPVIGDLPAGYTPLDSVRFTGKQVVDTLIVPDYYTEIEAEFTREQSTAMYLYGIRSTNNTTSVTAYLNTNGAWRFGNTYQNFTYTVGTNLHTSIANNSGVISNGVSYKYKGTVANFTALYTLTIGSARTTAGEYGDAQFVGKVSKFIMRRNGSTILEYKPCINPDGVCGFWDKARNVFHQSITDTPLQRA